MSEVRLVYCTDYNEDDLTETDMERQEPIHRPKLLNDLERAQSQLTAVVKAARASWWTELEGRARRTDLTIPQGIPDPRP
ncbi:hypothetical protein J6590_037638 [Homalodisca vitripennis]|nr:hypothetical protein J6590_037638 [Homalodisca vitripennis]